MPGVLLTAHVAAGALIALAVRKPVLVLPAAAASHLVLDIVPHWSVAGTWELWLQRAVLDGVLSVALAAVLFVAFPKALRPVVVLGVLGASLLDFDKPWRMLTGTELWPSWLHYAHTAFQKESLSLWWVDSLALLATISACFLLLSGRAVWSFSDGQSVPRKFTFGTRRGLAEATAALTVKGKSRKIAQRRLRHP